MTYSRNYAKFAASCFCLIALQACGSASVFTNRYLSISPSPPQEKQLITEAFIVKTSAPGKKVCDLPAEAQAAAIKEANSGSKMSPAEVANFMCMEIGAATKPVVSTDYTKFSRRIAVTLDYPRSSIAHVEADRINNLETNFSLSNPKDRFDSWSKLVNAYEEIDLGDVAFKQTSKATIETPVNGVTLGAEFGQENNETLRLRKQSLFAYPSLNGARAKIVQRGSFEKDLVGIQTIDLVVETEPAARKITNVVTKFAPAADKSSAKIAFNDVKVPAQCKDVVMKVSIDGFLRTVETGARSIVESDDIIRQDSLTSNDVDVTLVDRDQLQVKYWTLEKQSTARILKFSHRSGAFDTRFLSYDDAMNFIGWAKNQKSSVSLSSQSSGLVTIVDFNRLGDLVPVNGAYFGDVYPIFGSLNGGENIGGGIIDTCSRESASR